LNSLTVKVVTHNVVCETINLREFGVLQQEEPDALLGKLKLTIK